MRCHNPSCFGTPDFEHTPKERWFYDEFQIDPQTITYCRQCREARRIAWRNERTFFKRQCSQTGADIWATYDSKCPCPVFDKDVWWGDTWDGLQYGRDFDWNRPFFQQFHELVMAVPRPSVVQKKSKNADFCNDGENNVDCYMLFTADDNVNCHYGSGIACKDCIDCEELWQCELCADTIYSHTCNSMVGCSYCINSSNCYFSSNLVNCHNCIFSYGLRDRRNCIFNSEVSPDVFMQFIMQRQLFRRSQYRKSFKMFNMFMETVPQRYMFSIKSENVTGDKLINCKDCENTYSSEGCVNCVNLGGSSLDARDCMDCWAAAYGPQRSFENQTCLRGGFNFVANYSNDCVECSYIDNCQNCQSCFGCVGLKNKKYCIFNKQLTEEQYNEQKERIIAHMKKTKEWGHFFPFWCSPFAYNTTVAHLHYPLDTNQYLGLLKADEELFAPGPNYTKNHLWSMSLAKGPERQEAVVQPPDSLFEWSNEQILSTEFHDKKTHEPYQIMGRELALCQTLKIPLPNYCFRSRYTERWHRFNPRKLYRRRCQRTGVELESTFSPDSPFIVFSNDAWQQSLQ